MDPALTVIIIVGVIIFVGLYLNRKLSDLVEKQKPSDEILEYLKTTNIRLDEQSKQFLTDFFTDNELEAFSKRLAIAYWLKKGRSYNNIKNNLKVSSATIATVQVKMKTDGMKLAIKKIEAEEWANQWSEKIKKFIK